MTRFLCTLFVVLLRASYIETTWADEDDDFKKDCREATCGGLTIRYPFRLQSSPSYCGATGLEVACSGGDAVLALPQIGRCKMIHIDYQHGFVRIKLGESWARCPLRTLFSTNLTTPSYYFDGRFDLLLLNCSKEITPVPEGVAGPISCLGSEGRFAYVAELYVDMVDIPASCNADSPVRNISSDANGDNSFNATVQYFMRTQELNLRLTIPEIANCTACESEETCGFSRRRNQTYCMSGPHHGPNVKLIAGIASGGFVVVVLAAAALLAILYVVRKSEREQRTRVKVEKFLATYHSDAKPTRYSFADVKKMTKSFGMLVLEMVGGRKNLDPEIGKQSEVYFPELVYDRLVQSQDLGLAMEMEHEEEEEIMKKLVIVALWCIQWSPMDRPSMTRILQMLTGDLQSLQIPPKPFVSSLDHGN
ncbi:hypothetical protein OPV22_000871 [Ensete ventricosum]|uniref:Wall-associated receptor kinase galacturonan-binding domain-containing protein n=1 Tax=Ensete ventricosum TaxID=4639 RepID=A0AAV8RTQ2_ENSVE|nr:hypothetical protein OPV22_000869 [Ensete ventricosum]KAJ8510437.1 hypothetical protein OPV22_000871 [Ensete ventricosum]